MPKKPTTLRKTKAIADSPEKTAAATSVRLGKPSSLLDTRVIYCGDCLEQLQKLPPQCVDLIYIDPPFNSNRNYEVFWGRRRNALRVARASCALEGHRSSPRVTTCPRLL